MIGFFDSGKGGLTTLAKAYEYGFLGTSLYLGDKDNAPYGNKEKNELERIVRKNVELLQSLGCDEIFCACNTASLACEKSSFDIPFYTLPKIDIKKYDDAIYLGTEFTIKKLKETYCDNPSFLALPRLATLIDENEEKKVDEYLKDNLAKFKTADKIILGCTHYGLVKNKIEILFPSAKIVEISDGVQKYVRRFKNNGKSKIILFDEKYEEYRQILIKLLKNKRSDVKIVKLSNEHISRQ